MDSLPNSKWTKHRLSVEAWKLRNRPYYLAQKRRLAARPEYLAHRRVKYRLRQIARSLAEEISLSTIQTFDYDFETRNEAAAGRSHRGGGDPEGTQVRSGLDPAARQAAEGIGESSGGADASGEAFL